MRSTVRSDEVGRNLAVFFYHAQCFQFTQFGGDSRPAETKIIGDVLLRDRSVLIDVVVDQFEIGTADLSGSDCFFHFVCTFSELFM